VVKPSTAWCEIRLHEDSCRNSTIRRCIRDVLSLHRH